MNPRLFDRDRPDPFRELLEAAPDAMVIVNQRGDIVLVNSQTEKLFGYAREELLDRPVEILVPTRFAGHVAFRDRYFREPRARGMGEGRELFGRRRDGTEFPVEISLSPLQTEAGLLVSSSIRDITERHRARLALEEKNVELRRAIQAKDRFLASMSHELRTPLNAILGFTGTLLMRLPGPLTGEQERQLRTVQASGKHLLSLINDLLDLAKIESGKVEVQLEPLACQAVIEEVAASVRPLAEARHLGFILDLPPEPVMVQSARRPLQQILLNLVGNAIKFTDNGHVSVALAAQETTATIAVRDTGRGIAEKDRAAMFEAFVRVEDAQGQAREGTGLGLHLSRRLASLIDARLDLESEIGRGSTFTLTLPRRRG